MSISTISVQKGNLALEALTVSDLQNSLSRIFPKMVDNFKSFLETFNPKIPGIDLQVNDRVFMQSLKDVPYLDIESLAVTVPEGMDTDYLSYIKVLNACVTHSKEVQTIVLNKISLYLAMLVSDPNKRFDSAGLVKDMEKRAKARNDLIDEMNETTDSTSHNVKLPIGKVVQRNSDWEKIFTEFRSMARTANSIDRKALEKKIAEIVTLAETVIAKIKREELEGVSAEVATSLGEAVFNAAKELEFVGFTMYKAVACAQAISSSVSDIERMLTK